ncbi:MAG: DUF2088 domain-containing protein [Spirochaetes bacterium]|nr:DUF2088 domain-containing protein [Spirochaetota bacterium]
MIWFHKEGNDITNDEIRKLLITTAEKAKTHFPKKNGSVLLVPPDITRIKSGAGKLSKILYDKLSETLDVHLMPALGQHIPHTKKENEKMYGEVPSDKIHIHDAFDGCVRLGDVFDNDNYKVPISVNRELIEGQWDFIISIGQVVPHEIFGFSGYNKNLLIGLGGSDTIASSHILSAFYGIENIMGRIDNPIREIFNLAEEKYLKDIPVVHILLVMGKGDDGKPVYKGVYAGTGLETYNKAVKESRRQNIYFLDRPEKKIVCYMPDVQSTWIANKAVYRSRMAVADYGKIIVIARDIKRFGDHENIDSIIRTHGYCGMDKIKSIYAKDQSLEKYAHAFAHLIHGSSEGRFDVVYACENDWSLEFEKVNYQWIDYKEAVEKYRPHGRTEGRYTTEDGEDFYFIPQPAMGLWQLRDS